MINIVDLPMVLYHMGFTDDQFDVSDDGDGPYIKEWLAAAPKPTRAEIELAYPGAMAAQAAMLAAQAAHTAKG